MLCKALEAEAQYGRDPQLAMRGLESLCDGLWFGVAADGAGHPGRVNPEEARRIVERRLRPSSRAISPFPATDWRTSDCLFRNVAKVL